MKNSKMRPFSSGGTAIAVTVLLTLSFAFPSCKKNDNAPTPPAATPVISDFSPKKALVGTTITITGTNFDVTPANNVIKFNGITATVSQATATQLVVIVPQTATTGKISAMVNNQTGMSTVDFVVRPPLKLSSNSGFLNQVLYLTGGPGFGTVADHNGLSITGSGPSIFSVVLGYTDDTVVILVPYAVPGVYKDSARVNDIMVSLGTFTIDTPSLTSMGIVNNVTPGTAAKGATASISVINGSVVAGSTTVALVAIYQQTAVPVGLPCTVNTLTAGVFGSTNISFVIPNGVVSGTSYAIKVTVNGVTAYGGLNSWFTAL